MTGNLYVYVLQEHFTSPEEYAKNHRYSKSKVYYELSKGLVPEFKIYGVDICDLNDFVNLVHKDIKKVLDVANPYEEPDDPGETYCYTFCYKFVWMKNNFEELEFRQFVKSYTKETNYVLK